MNAEFIDNPYFKRKEFECKCGCGGDVVDANLLESLVLVRATLANPLIITSGYRCEEWNKKVGGSPKSKHLSGEAADFYIKNVPLHEVRSLLITIYPDSHGIGYYPDQNFIHLDVRSEKARWTK